MTQTIEHLELDADVLSVTELNKALREAARKKQPVSVINPAARHLLAVGIENGAEITFEGSIGYFGGGLNTESMLTVNGNAGWFFGDNLMGGKLTVNGNTGSGLGPGMVKGTIAVHGNAGSRTGAVQKGGFILIEGNAGFMTGFTMIGGKIIVLGDIGPQAGHFMWGGEIYCGGRIESIGDGATEVDPSDEDIAEIQALIESNGMKMPSSIRKVMKAEA